MLSFATNWGTVSSGYSDLVLYEKKTIISNLLVPIKALAFRTTAAAGGHRLVNLLPHRSSNSFASDPSLFTSCLSKSFIWVKSDSMISHGTPLPNGSTGHEWLSSLSTFFLYCQFRWNHLLKFSSIFFIYILNLLILFQCSKVNISSYLEPWCRI